MISEQENNLLTQTGPRTPCGELMRRYWQPVALSEELAGESPPLKLRILGEDLVLFRDDQGRPGLLGLHCSHRVIHVPLGTTQRMKMIALRCHRPMTSGRSVSSASSLYRVGPEYSKGTLSVAPAVG